MRSVLTLFTLIFSQHALSVQPNNELVFKLKASVVKVHVATKSGGHGVGTGVVIGKDSVVTNCHVIANAAGVKISKFGESFVPDTMKADWKHDICILRFQYLDLIPVELGDSENLANEQAIFSIGFPGGPPKPQSTYGKIKALYPLDDSQIVRTDASFVMGASGSPVFDAEGKLVALSTFKSPGHGAYFYNMPVKWIKALLNAPDTASLNTVSLNTNELPFWDAPELQRPFFMRVVLPYQNEKWADLKIVAQEWIAAEPTNPEAFFYAGVAEENLGNLTQANQYFQKTLNLHPQHVATLIELGLMANRAGKADDVEKTRVALKAINGELDEEFMEALKPATNQ